MISKYNSINDGKVEFKIGMYYPVIDRYITGETVVLSENNTQVRLHPKELEERFIDKLDACFMFAGYEYYDNGNGKYSRHAFNSLEREDITFEEYMDASSKWEMYKIK